MKILIVGANHSQAIENHYIDGLEEYCEVDFCNIHGLFQKVYHKNWWNKIVFRLGFSKLYSLLNKRLIRKVEKSQPDAIFVFKGMEIYPGTLKLFRSKQIVLVNYNPDHPLKHFSKGSGNKNILNSISLYDHHFCYSRQIETEIKQKFDCSTSWLPFAYNFQKKNDSNELRRRVAFFGNPDQYRIDLFNQLLSHGIPLSLFGFNWDNTVESKYLDSGDCEIIKSTFNVELAQRYALHLNVFRDHNEGGHNLRTFEVPAIGCILVTPYSKEQAELFEQDKEAIFYSSTKELFDKIKYVLTLSDSKIKEIQENAYQRSIKGAYNYDSRCKHVYEVVDNLINDIESFKQ